MINKPFERLFGQLRRLVGVTAVITIVSLVSTVVGVSWVAYRDHHQHNAVASASTNTASHPNVASASDGWGKEAIALIHSDLFASIGITPANACGMGATSCYKCHNGRQAEAPDTKPWHVQHIPVNYSCNGCHQGNPRLMNKSIAHSGMLPNPLTNTKEACAACHTDASKLSKYVASYKQIYHKKD